MTTTVTKIKRLSRMFPASFGGTHVQENLIGKHRASISRAQNLMLQSGLLIPSTPGIYHYMPFLQRSITKLIKIIDQKLDEIDCDKVQLATLSPKTLWMKSNRWEGFGDELVRAKVLKNEFCLAPTHEEAISDVVSKYARNLSHVQLPVKLYQITNKYRAELEPKHGLLRCREFIMKDLYTFDTDHQNAVSTYTRVMQAYDEIFRHLELDIVKIKADGGLIGGDMTHEYHLIADVGEDRVAINSATKEASSDLEQAGCVVHNTIELGHTFYLGTGYSTKFKATYLDVEKRSIPCEMGCYGLGVTRIIAAAVEDMSVEKGMRWPKALAPYKVCIITPREGSGEFGEACELVEDKLWSDLCDVVGDDVVWDDRHKKTIGWRMRHANLLGYPLVFVVGKDLSHGLVEVIEQVSRKRDVNQPQLVDIGKIAEFTRTYFDSYL